MTDWCIRQRTVAGLACVWVRAPDARAAVRIAAWRVGRLGGWPVPPGCDDLEVFPAAQYAGRATVRDYTRMVIG